jgi:hypothetical protein
VPYSKIQKNIAGMITLVETLVESEPEITEYSHVYNPPLILHETAIPAMGEVVATRITFSNLKPKKRKEPSSTPEGMNLVASSKLIGARGVVNLANLRKPKEPKYISVVHVTL